MAPWFTIVVAILIVLIVLVVGLLVSRFDVDFEGDAIAIRSSLRLALSPTWRIPFDKIRKIEVYRPKSILNQLNFLLAYLFASRWYSTLADCYVIVETKSTAYVFSPPDPEGFSEELEAKRKDWLEGPKRGKWGLG